MYPILFKIGLISVYSFGLMMAIAFLTANYFFAQEVKRRGENEKLVTAITIIALVGGVAGSKLFSIFEDWDAFVRFPIKTIFSPSGLTFYGGFIVATIGILVYLRKRKISFLKFADMIAPVVFLAYGIGRIGCQLAGDGDYGIPTTEPWGMHYTLGTAKPTLVFEEYFVRFPAERTFWKYDSLRAITTSVDALGQQVTRFDEVVTCQPTPLFETIIAIVCFIILWRSREKLSSVPGRLFYITIILMGIERFLVEILRINPLYIGLSMAQWISIALVLYGLMMLSRRTLETPKAIR
ncbi:MAG TPA: prolipoprotein diacylglyceryl transferase [Candidatus Kapabacteria bacterium]|nr:prolipoprotein diacylglyceryl transferase [Candidatus Kapabacteria bacterium]